MAFGPSTTIDIVFSKSEFIRKLNGWGCTVGIVSVNQKIPQFRSHRNAVAIEPLLSVGVNVKKIIVDVL